MLIKENNILVMQGDSITDTGRERPFGEGNNRLGDGYVKYVDAFLKTAYPERKIRVINTGISGNTTEDLIKRWDVDTLDLSPNWVSIMIGANDVWRQFDNPLLIKTHVLTENYKSNYKKIIERTFNETNGIILLSPYYMGQSEDDRFRIKMLEYIEIVKDLAKEYNLIYGDTQAAFDEHFKHYHPHSVNADCIHPNHTGSMIIAKTFLNAVRFNWDLMK